MRISALLPVFAIGLPHVLASGCGDGDRGGGGRTTLGASGGITSAGSGGDGDGDGTGSGDGDGDGDGTGSGDGDGDGTESGDGDGDGTESGGGNGDGDGDGGVRLDVGGGMETGGPGEGGGGECDPNVDEECSCTGVDILFVVDNSVSMASHQAALGQAFPDFARAIADVLPAATSVHVGVTSTEMGFIAEGATSECSWFGDGTEMDYYDTPDMGNSGRNGAQGRLYRPSGQPAFYEFRTNDPTAIDGAATWFANAARVGTGGSNLEMALAPAAWAFDAANNPTNGGFLRDAGTVLVVFFVQDEPDQTPTESGVPADLVDRIAAAKMLCGGLDCVVAGGAINEACLPSVALGTFFDALDPSVVNTADLSRLSNNGGRDFFVDLLENNLAEVIARKCDDITPPVG